MSFGGNVNTFQKYSENFGLGHNGVTVSLNYFDGIPEQALINSLQSNKLVLVFKSLLKRDETTKEKALNDLFALIDEINDNGEKYLFENDIFTLCWTQLYAKLVVNESKTIRILSHQISMRLIILLNKKIGKFLKDLIPLVLLGCCDSDSSVAQSCKKELLTCFNNDSKKVKSLWSVFHEQILTLAKVVIVIETEITISDEHYVEKDLSSLRYKKLMTSVIYLFNELISTSYAEDSKLDEFKSDYKQILTEESLWKQLNFKKANNLKTFESLLKLIQILNKVGYLKTNKDVLKQVSKYVLKSLSQVNSKNAMTISSLFNPILNVLVLLDNFKDGKFWSYDKSSKDKLINFLTTVSNNPTPGVFVCMYELYEKIDSHHILDAESEWLPLWRNAIKSLNEKSFLGRFGAQLIFEFWTEYLKFLENANINAIDIKEEDIIGTLKSGNSIAQLNGLVKVLSNSLSSKCLEQKLEELIKNYEEGKIYSALVQNILNLMLSNIDNEEALHSLTMYLQSYILDSPFAVLKGNPEIIKIYIILIKSGLPFLFDDICRIMYEIPTLLDETFYPSLSTIIVEFSKSQFISMSSEEINPYESIEDFFTVSIRMSIDPVFIIRTMNSIDKQVISQLTRDSDSSIHGFVTDYIKSYNYEDSGEFIRNPLVTKNNISELYENTCRNGKLEELSKHLSSMDVEILEFLFEKTSFLSSSYLKFSDEISDNIFKATATVSKNNESIAVTLADCIVNHSKKHYNSNQGLSLEHALQLVSTNRNVVEKLLPNDIDSLIEEYVPFIDYRFALVNNLGLNSHLLDIPTKQVDLSKIEELIRFGLFIDSLLLNLQEYRNDNLTFLMTLLFELATDYNCVSDEPKDEYQNFENSIFRLQTKDINFKNVIKSIMQDFNGPLTEGNEISLSPVMSDEYSTNDVITFYKSRILYKILLNEVDSISNTTYKELVPLVEDYITKTIRSKEHNASNMMNSAIVLLVLENFNGDELFNKQRTLLGCELIGVMGKELIDRTYKSIILLTNMLKVSNPSDTFLPIISQRLNLILSSAGKILDTEVVYEESFVIVRLSLLQMFGLLLKFPSFSEFDFSVIERLLADSLSMCQLDDTPYLLELRSSCLDVYQQLIKVKDDTENGEYDLEISDGIIEMCFIEFPRECNNQISMKFYATLTKVISSFSNHILMECYERFLKTFLKNKEKKTINQSRLIIVILGRLIYEKQQESIIEYEFNKQQTPNIVEETDERDDNQNKLSMKFELPNQLVELLSSDIPQEYLEYEDKYKFIKYLWYWYLTMEFFKDTSYNLRQLHIDQLRRKDLINKIYDFIGDQIDLQDSKFWKTVETDTILNYDITNDQFSPYEEDVFIESKKLLAHLMYKLFVNVGSITSTWWLNIKDRSLQTNIEKYVSQYISPILITHELQDVSKKMERLTSKDDALSIKINKITNEVKASYLIDEQKLEISFKLPENYPLTNVEVNGLSRVGISEQKWKQWIMSTQRVITNMNGSVMDSLELFTKNVNLQFSGFEECAICYSILHAVDRKLPTKTCPTCSNKFHDACLYKWFRSSGNNTCPMCRSDIPFRR